jgi:hypothetical protein
MISLDSRLRGDVLRLRPSMIKFEGTDAWNIEICGSGINPLPLYLNRQVIKILEDLGVPAQPFIDLQQSEIDRLRVTAQSPQLASNFLQRSNVGHAAKLPWLIKVIDTLGLSFSQDNFLRRAIELAVLFQLRELKYRSRILVEKGVTLYGIMDETGFLEEGQVFCPTSDGNGRVNVLLGEDMVLTRSPALHPGDVRIVDAVPVPEDSPLNDLHNCIVFSQQGSRDEPSKAAGGDLDGDLYNLIYDKRLRPKKTAFPADYPRDSQPPLQRPVTKNDIIDFFLTFMQQDQLGRIATLHQTLADHRPNGTFDSDCITLAELHSTAVDFSKTGIPVLLYTDLERPFANNN